MDILKQRKKTEYVNELEQILKKNITDTDIKKYFENPLILEYKDLEKYVDIYEILPEHKSFCFLLLETSKRKGHWMLLCRYKDTIELFDSYGQSLVKEFSYIPKSVRRLLGEKPDTLKYLLKHTSKPEDEVIYNLTPLQSDKEGINTCGRWCILRAQALQKLTYTLEEFLDWIETQSEARKIPPDVFVCRIINQ
jgi:hypothetical protein